jgi:tetratricopeptide (TPR) repeat protein
LRDQALALLQAQCQASDASPSTLMELGDEYQNQKHTDAAIELYRRALTQDYGQVEWRLKLADALAKTDRSAEAIHEARICLQLRPALKTAEDLIAELSVRPGSAMDH